MTFRHKALLSTQKKVMQQIYYIWFKWFAYQSPEAQKLVCKA